MDLILPAHNLSAVLGPPVPPPRELFIVVERSLRVVVGHADQIQPGYDDVERVTHNAYDLV